MQLTIKPNTTYVIASVFTEDDPDNEQRHEDVIDFLDSSGLDYEECQSFYTHKNGAQVMERSIFMEECVWDSLWINRQDWFTCQESILVLQADGDDGSAWAMLQPTNGYSLPFMLGRWRRAKASIAVTMPAYTVHDGDYYYCVAA